MRNELPPFGQLVHGSPVFQRRKTQTVIAADNVRDGRHDRSLFVNILRLFRAPRGSGFSPCLGNPLPVVFLDVILVVNLDLDGNVAGICFLLQG